MKIHQDTDILVVIDVQNDFCPLGKLAVADGDRVVPVINDIAKNFRHVVMTQTGTRKATPPLPRAIPAMVPSPRSTCHMAPNALARSLHPGINRSALPS